MGGRGKTKLPHTSLKLMSNAILFPKTPFGTIVSDDGDVGLKVRYIGDEPRGSVTVNSSGDITFKIGESGSLSVDSTIDSGDDTGGSSDPGVIDVSDDSNLTFGQVVDMINSSPNWEAYLVDVLRGDNANKNTGSLKQMAEAVLMQREEVSLNKDTSKVLNISIRMGRRTNTNGSEAVTAAELYEIFSNNTYSAGTNTIEVYRVDEKAQTEEKIYSKSGGASGSDDTKEFVVNGRGGIGSQKQGEHLLVRMVGSDECTGQLQVLGATAAGA